MHRAVRFLLEQAKMNNRDITPEADHHMEVLDEELGNSKELEAAKKPKPEVVAPPAPAPEEEKRDEPQTDTAAVLRQSSRFSRRG
jgi:hypothetical protein